MTVYPNSLVRSPAYFCNASKRNYFTASDSRKHIKLSGKVLYSFSECIERTPGLKLYIEFVIINKVYVVLYFNVCSKLYAR